MGSVQSDPLSGRAVSRVTRGKERTRVDSTTSRCVARETGIGGDSLPFGAAAGIGPRCEQHRISTLARGDRAVRITGFCLHE
jgi:hypothetical protein